MKKRLLFVSICTALSFGINAQEETTSTVKEKELLEILNTLEGKKNSEKILTTEEDKASKNEEVNSSLENVYISSDEDKSNEELNNNSNFEKIISNSSEQFDEQDNLEFDLSNNDHVYLLNIPIKTRIYANKDFHIYPFRDGMIFDDGKIRASSPLNFSDKTTYCYFSVEKSGNTRRLKAVKDDNPEKALNIEANNSKKIIAKSNIDESIVITKYETSFKLDNPHIKVLKCLTTEKNLPLTIGDLHFETGGMFRFEFPEIVDIN